MKYSCCLYPTGNETLDQAEILMLEDYCIKAKLEDGMDVLDLGCGWGSLSLFLAKVCVTINHFEQQLLISYKYLEISKF